MTAARRAAPPGGVPAGPLAFVPGPGAFAGWGRGVAIRPCTRQTEAFRMANAVSQGWAASIRTRGRDPAVHAGRALHNGIVRVTAHGLTVSVTPHGGGRHSGAGSDPSRTGPFDYTQVKHVRCEGAGGPDAPSRFPVGGISRAGGLWPDQASDGCSDVAILGRPGNPPEPILRRP
ncbi:aldehyde dehydrogenase family protein [Streptomyces sp. NPDC014940]|uniref:aldehyde dehydrogenase family protein n=1 Tax=Streptomyces sp. NPDC014940 TaxID=3364932 RepID=UPI0037027234